MFGKNGPNLPNIGKSIRRAIFKFCQPLAKSEEICQALAKRSFRQTGPSPPGCLYRSWRPVGLCMQPLPVGSESSKTTAASGLPFWAMPLSSRLDNATHCLRLSFAASPKNPASEAGIFFVTPPRGAAPDAPGAGAVAVFLRGAVHASRAVTRRAAPLAVLFVIPVFVLQESFPEGIAIVSPDFSPSSRRRSEGDVVHRRCFDDEESGQKDKKKCNLLREDFPGRAVDAPRPVTRRSAPSAFRCHFQLLWLLSYWLSLASPSKRSGVPISQSKPFNKFSDLFDNRRYLKKPGQGPTRRINTMGHTNPICMCFLTPLLP